MRYQTTARRVSGRADRDRRVQKTQRSLHQALIALIREKDYDRISVRDILDRADVGRSTFYAHYADKNELLVSGIHEMVKAARSPSRSPAPSEEPFTWFSLPVFEHHDRHRHEAAHMTAKARRFLHSCLRSVIADLIRAELQQTAGRRPPRGSIPADLLVHYVASTFVLVLNWWLESCSALRPAAVDHLFRSLVSPALASL